jgi:hypothetical protein
MVESGNKSEYLLYNDSSGKYTYLYPLIFVLIEPGIFSLSKISKIFGNLPLKVK